MSNNYDAQNIFAKMLREEIPSIRVYEDSTTLAFMDIMPQTEGHTLVIPKEAATDLHNLSAEAAADLIQKVQLIAAAVKQAVQADGITLMQLNGSAAGQSVPHIHFHIIPGSILGAREHASQPADQADLETIAARIRKHLPSGN